MGLQKSSFDYLVEVLRTFRLVEWLEWYVKDVSLWARREWRSIYEVDAIGGALGVESVQCSGFA